MTHNELGELLTDKSVVVVGRAPYLLKQLNGKFIDSHDVVVRVNNPLPYMSSAIDLTRYKDNFVNEYYHYNLGKNTHLMFLNPGAMKHELSARDMLGAKLFVQDGGKVFCSYEKRNSLKYESLGIEFYEITPRLRADLNRRLFIYYMEIEGINDIQPKYVRVTMGMQAILSLLSFDIKSLFITGFSFYLTDEDAVYRKEGSELKPNRHVTFTELCWLGTIVDHDDRVKIDSSIEFMIQHMYN